MEVFFRSRKLQKVCENEKAMLREFGKTRTTKLMNRLNELHGLANLGLVPHTPPPRCHMLAGNRAGQFSVDLDHPYRLIFIPANDPLPLKPDGGLDLVLVTAVEILEIADSH